MASTVIYSLVFPGSAGTGEKRSRRLDTIRGHKGSDELDRAFREMNVDTPKELAILSGGVSIRFNDQPSFNSGLIEIVAHIRDGYTLGFQPNLRASGFHKIRVAVHPGNSKLLIRLSPSDAFEEMPKMYLTLNLPLGMVIGGKRYPSSCLNALSFGVANLLPW